MFRKAALALVLLSSADAIPAKGCCSSTPDTPTIGAGTQCAFGHAACASGLECALACSADAGADAGQQGTLICTKTCANDADCASLGAGFVCGGTCGGSARTCHK